MLRALVFEGENEDLSVAVTTRPAGLTAGRELRVRTTTYVRDLPQVKNVAFFGAVRERRLAQQAGYDDALFLSPDGRLVEGPTWNVAVVLDDEIVWPDDFCLPGVTRTLLQQVLDAAGRRWSGRTVSRAELPRVRAAFATSAGGVRRISSIDHAVLPGDAELEKLLLAGYAALPAEPL